MLPDIPGQEMQTQGPPSSPELWEKPGFTGREHPSPRAEQCLQENSLKPGFFPRKKERNNIKKKNKNHPVNPSPCRALAAVPEGRNIWKFIPSQLRQLPAARASPVISSARAPVRTSLAAGSACAELLLFQARCERETPGFYSNPIQKQSERTARSGAAEPGGSEIRQLLMSSEPEPPALCSAA